MITATLLIVNKLRADDCDVVAWRSRVSGPVPARVRAPGRIRPKLRGLRVGISCLTRQTSPPSASECSQENLGVSPWFPCSTLLGCGHAGAADGDACGQDQELAHRQAGTAPGI